MLGGGNDADGADQTAGAHTGGYTVAMELEDHGGDGACDGGGQGGGHPNHGPAADVAHLEHGGAQSLGDQTAPLVFPEAGDRKAYHLGTAARYGGTARQEKPVQVAVEGGDLNGGGGEDHGADGRAGNGQS